MSFPNMSLSVPSSVNDAFNSDFHDSFDSLTEEQVNQEINEATGFDFPSPVFAGHSGDALYPIGGSFDAANFTDLTILQPTPSLSPVQYAADTGIDPAHVYVENTWSGEFTEDFSWMNTGDVDLAPLSSDQCADNTGILDAPDFGESNASGDDDVDMPSLPDDSWLEMPTYFPVGIDPSPLSSVQHAIDTGTIGTLAVNSTSLSRDDTSSAASTSFTAPTTPATSASSVASSSSASSSFAGAMLPTPPVSPQKANNRLGQRPGLKQALDTHKRYCELGNDLLSDEGCRANCPLRSYTHTKPNGQPAPRPHGVRMAERWVIVDGTCKGQVWCGLWEHEYPGPMRQQKVPGVPTRSRK